MNKFSVKARHKSRRFLIQALYQWQFNHTTLGELEAEYLLEETMKKADLAYFRELLAGILPQVAALDAVFTPLLDRPLEDMTPVELAVLRLAAYELKNRLDVPYRVVLDEALELTKTFGATEGHKFVNGVLNKLAHQLRSQEIQA